MSATPESFVDQLDADTTEAKVDEVKDEVKDKVDTAKPDEKAEKVVPLKALQEEREAAKELKRQIAELQAQPKLSDEDKQLLAELKAAKAAQKPKDVDFMDDPKGYVDTKVKAALEAVEQANKKAEAADTAVNQQRQIQALMTAVSAHETAFVTANPDYYQALEHVRSVRASQMRLMDSSLTDQQVSQAIAQEELAAAQHLISKGADPCNFAYQYAKTLGYAPKAADKTDPSQSDLVKAAKAADKAGVRTMGAGGGDAPAQEDADPDDPNAEFNAVKALFRKR
jgi:hypothetical protein